MFYFEGLGVAIVLFLIIGLFHPLVIKGEYYFGVKIWWSFLVAGIIFVGASLFTAHLFFSTVLGVLGATCFWSVKEIFDQKERVKKGWFPKNPKRDYSDY